MEASGTEEANEAWERACDMEGRVRGPALCC